MHSTTLYWDGVLHVSTDWVQTGSQAFSVSDIQFVRLRTFKSNGAMSGAASLIFALLIVVLVQFWLRSSSIPDQNRSSVPEDFFFYLFLALLVISLIAIPLALMYAKKVFYEFFSVQIRAERSWKNISSRWIPVFASVDQNEAVAVERAINQAVSVMNKMSPLPARRDVPTNITYQEPIDRVGWEPAYGSTTPSLLFSKGNVQVTYDAATFGQTTYRLEEIRSIRSGRVPVGYYTSALPLIISLATVIQGTVPYLRYLLPPGMRSAADCLMFPLIFIYFISAANSLAGSANVSIIRLKDASGWHVVLASVDATYVSRAVDAVKAARQVQTKPAEAGA